MTSIEKVSPIAFVACSLAVLVAGSTAAQRVERYRFLETEELGFHYDSGFFGYRIDASLAGEFEVTYPAGGNAFISAFDVQIGQAEIQSPVQRAVVLKPQLADYLWEDPVGLPFGPILADLPASDCDAYICSLFPPGVSSQDIALTALWVESGDGNLGTFHLRSNVRWSIIDGHSAKTGGAGLPVQLIPEPNAIRIASVLLVVSAPVVSARRRHHFQTKSP